MSSQDQNLDRQLAMMEDLNIDKLFQEKASGKDIQRPEFQKLLNYIREGDCVIVAQFLDFNTGNELLDTAMFDMFLSLLSYIAQNEREKIRERQRQGVLLAKKAGRYKGRPIEYSENSTDPQKRLVFKTVVDMLNQGVPVAEIAKENGLSRPTIYKIKKANDL